MLLKSMKRSAVKQKYFVMNFVTKNMKCRIYGIYSILFGGFKSH